MKCLDRKPVQIVHNFFMPWSRQTGSSPNRNWLSLRNTLHIPGHGTEQKLHMNGALGNRTRLALLTFPQLSMGASPPKMDLQNGNTLFTSLVQGFDKCSCQQDIILQKGCQQKGKKVSIGVIRGTCFGLWIMKELMRVESRRVKNGNYKDREMEEKSRCLGAKAEKVSQVEAEVRHRNF